MIYDIWDKLMFMIDPSMPDPMRSGLVDKVGLIWPSNFSRCNTERMGFSHLYQCSHFHSWNRYSMDVSRFLTTLCFQLHELEYDRVQKRRKMHASLIW